MHHENQIKFNYTNFKFRDRITLLLIDMCIANNYLFDIEP